MLIHKVLQSAQLMDETALRNLSRSQIQQLARKENIKANIKTDLIIRQLLKKYPQGVPRVISSPKVFQKKINVRVKVKEETVEPDSQGSPSPIAPAEPEQPAIQEPLVSQHPAPLDETPFAANGVPTPELSPIEPTLSALPRTPIRGSPALVQGAPPQATPAPAHRSPTPPPLPPTYSETREMLRTLTNLINATSLTSSHPTSIEYQINAIDQLLDEKILPRIMKVDKDIKDMIWTRQALETECIAKFKEPGILHEDILGKKVYNFGGDGLPSPRNPFEGKRKRTYAEDDTGGYPEDELSPSKRSRIVSVS